MTSGRRAVLGGRAALVVSALLLLVLGAFFPIFGNGFINYDDGAYITTNPFINGGLTLRGVRWAFTTSHMGNWHPLTWLSHLLDVELFGLRPAGHHAVSLLIHAANTLLLFVLFRSLTGAFWRSALIAAFFAVHPLHVESVAWAAERKDVLSTLFALLTLQAWRKQLQHPGTVRPLAVPALFALGLAAKPMYVTLPFVMVLLDWWPLGRWSPGRWALPPLALWREKAPLLALSAVCGLVTYLFQSRGGALMTGELLQLPMRAANAFITYIRYLGKIFRPADLAVFYPYPGHIPAYQLWGSVLLLLVISFVVVRFARRRPYLVTGWFWYLGMLVPVIGLVQVGAQAMADRYTYLPLTGVFLLIIWGFDELTPGRPLLRISSAFAAMACLLTLSAISHAQVKIWQDDFHLFQHALRVTERNWLAHINLGNALAWTGKTEAAIVQFREALKVSPDDPMAQNNLALELKKLGKVDEAIALYRRVLDAHPRLDYVHCNLGLALAGKKINAEAEKHYRRALEINPRYTSAMNNLGNLFYAQGKNDDAVSWYHEALEIDPRYAEARFNLGLALSARGSFQEAVEELRDAVRLNPGDTAGLLLLGDVLTVLERPSEARTTYEKALAIDPDLAEAWQRLEASALRKP